MTERNAPCPCGSGKKFKHCCMKDFSKGGSPTATRVMVIKPPESPRTNRVTPLMMNFAAAAMLQRMRERGAPDA